MDIKDRKKLLANAIILETCQPQAVEKSIGQVIEFYIAANQEGATYRETLLQPQQLRQCLSGLWLSPQLP